MAEPRVRYSEDVDILYIAFGGPNMRAAKTKELDPLRLIDLDSDGNVIGIEFIDASAGINLTDIPERDTVERLVRAHAPSFPVLA